MSGENERCRRETIRKEEAPGKYKRKINIQKEKDRGEEKEKIIDM